MARNGTGTYNLPAGNPVTAGLPITDTWANGTLADIATALTNSLSADGQTVVTADLGMGNNKLVGLGDGSAVTHGATLGQVQKGSPQVVGAVGGTTTAYTGTLPYSTTVFAAGQHVWITPNASNTGAVTLALNGGTAYAVKDYAGNALSALDFPIGVPCLLNWTGAEWRLVTVTKPTVQTTWGTYTPTITSLYNIASAIASVFKWSRVGNMVSVCGVVTIQATTYAGNPCDWHLSLPVSSDFTATEDCVGMGLDGDSGKGGFVFGWPSDNTVFCRVIRTDPNNEDVSVMFSYIVK